jgi:competence protein ComEC
MRRWLPALAALYVTGIVVAGSGCHDTERWTWAGLHGLALGLVWPRLRVVAALTVTLAAGAVTASGSLEAVRPATPKETAPVVVEGRVEAVRTGRSGPRLVLREVVPIEPAERSVPRGLLLFAGAAPALAGAATGDWVRVAVRIAPPRGARNPGARDAARSLRRQGVGALATLVHPGLSMLLEGPRANTWISLEERRRRGVERLRRYGLGGGVLAALGLGEGRAIEGPTRAALARLGLAHLVAVSGLHLALVAAPLYLVLAAGLRRSATLAARLDTRRLAVVGACGGAALYASLTGFGAPIQRALAFLVVLTLAHWLRRPPRPASAFSAAALCVCIAEPAAPFAPGVQLSFLATAALVWARPAPSDVAQHDGMLVAQHDGMLVALRDGVVAVLRASASASAATAGLVAWHFGVVSPVGWLSNALAVPLTSVLLLPLALGASLLAMGAPPDGGAEPLLAIACALAGRLAQGCLWLAPHVPAWSAVAPGALGLAASGALALACVRSGRTGVRLALAALAAAAPALGPPPSIDPPRPRVVFLDVQGRRASVLIDAGSAVRTPRIDFDAGERVVLPALAALGVRRLDLAVASHADLDHRGGLVTVLRALPVARLWLPPGGRADPAFAALRETATRNGTAVAERAPDEGALVIGDLCFEALWPPRAHRHLTRNDASLVVRASVAGHGVLFAGDVEAAGERGLLARGAAIDAAVLKLAHHGSRSSSSRAFLEAVRPAFAVVSAPRRGRFGMPHAEVRRRLAGLGVPWGWTGRDGAVLVGLGARPRARTFAGAEAPWRLAPRRRAACGLPEKREPPSKAVEGRIGRPGAGAEALNAPGSGAGGAPRRRAGPRGRLPSGEAVGRAPPGARRPRAGRGRAARARPPGSPGPPAGRWTRSRPPRRTHARGALSARRGR